MSSAANWSVIFCVIALAFSPPWSAAATPSAQRRLSLRGSRNRPRHGCLGALVGCRVKGAMATAQGRAQPLS